MGSDRFPQYRPAHAACVEPGIWLNSVMPGEDRAVKLDVMRDNDDFRPIEARKFVTRVYGTPLGHTIDIPGIGIPVSVELRIPHVFAQGDRFEVVAVFTAKIGLVVYEEKLLICER